MSSLLDFEIRPDHMVGRDVLLNRGICHDRAGRGALRAADHIDRKAVFIQVPDQLHHREIEIVDVAHVVEACGRLLPEFNCIVIEFLHRHSGIRFGKIPRESLICDIAGLYGRRDLFQLIRDPFRMIVQTVLNEHHGIVVGIVGLTGEGSVHVKHGNAVLFGNKAVRILRVRHPGHIVSEALRYLRA